VIQASVMAVSVFFVFANLAVDIVARRLDPRYELR
jgi:ABC-type dipeptide/oligopeptide/nickel transport system permease component